MAPSKHSVFDWIREGHDKEHVVEAVTMFRRIVYSKTVPPKSDLRRVLVEALAKFSSEGWRIESFCDNRSGFFCSKNGERLYVSIRETGPGYGSTSAFLNNRTTS